MIKRSFQLIALLVLLPLATTGFAQIERFVAGTHYVVLDAPVNTRDSSKIEVIEAFWYGCSHCFRFEPLVENWESSAGADVDFTRFPAVWNGLMKIHAQVYYTAEALDVLDTVHEPVFNAINIQGNRLQSQDAIGELFAEHGIAKEEFEKTFNSFSVTSRTKQAEQRMQKYQIRSTPNMIVNGKYIITTGANVQTQADMLEVVDFLVEKERQAMSSAGE